MTTFVITGPDGKEYEVDGPEGSTPEQALAQVQAQVGQTKEQPGLSPEYQKALRFYSMTNPFVLAGKGMELAGHAIDRAGYNVGGAVTDAAANVLPAERTNPLQYMIPTAPEVGFAANVGLQTLPAILGGEAGKLASPSFQSAARRLVQSAIKPNKQALETGKAQQAIETILERNIPTSEAGMSGVQGTVKNLDAQVKNIIGNSQERVGTAAAARPLIEAIRETNNIPMSADRRNALVAKLEEFMAENPENMSVQRAQQLKQGAYKDVGNRPYMATQDQAVALSDEAKMLAAKGLKNEIAAVEPGVVPLNAEQSKLLNVLKVAGPKLLMEGNKNPLSFGTFAPSWERLLGWLLDRDAAAKGLLGRTLYKGSERIPQTIAELMSAAATGYNNRAPALAPENGGALYYEPPQRGSPKGILGGGTR